MNDITVLFEDSELLVINKPPGIVVNRAESVHGETVADWVEAYLHLEKPTQVARVPYDADNPPDPHTEFLLRSGVVHRIDKETSGCLIIAKQTDAFVELQRQFKEHVVKKTYLAIAHGKLVPEEGEIRAPVGRLPWSPERFGIVPGGKESVTRYKVVSSSLYPVSAKKTEAISVVELYPETGRTHQIRVHLKYINHPIVGDWQYAGRKTSRSDRVWAPRVMLHAWKVMLIHPTTGKELAIEAPIPDDMNRIIS